MQLDQNLIPCTSRLCLIPCILTAAWLLVCMSANRKSLPAQPVQLRCFLKLCYCRQPVFNQPMVVPCILS